LESKTKKIIQNKPRDYIAEQRAINLEKKRLAEGEGKKSKASKKRFVKKRKNRTKSK